MMAARPCGLEAQLQSFLQLLVQCLGKALQQQIAFFLKVSQVA